MSTFDFKNSYYLHLFRSSATFAYSPNVFMVGTFIESVRRPTPTLYRCPASVDAYDAALPLALDEHGGISVPWLPLSCSETAKYKNPFSEGKATDFQNLFLDSESRHLVSPRNRFVVESKDRIKWRT